jgi:hypothetical protein
MKLSSLRFILPLVCLALSATLHAQGVLLASGGRARATIVTADQPTPAEKSAAAELAHYLERISGARFTIRPASGKPAEPSILIGAAGGRTGLDKLGPEGFRIDTERGNLLLRGSDDVGTEFAVYTFLEKHLGVRWYWPGELGELVPRREEIRLGELHESQEPAFKWRHRGPGGALWGAASGPTEMRQRELVLGVSEQHQREVRLWEKRNKWGGWKTYGGHALGEIFPPEKYGKTHPEYYALVKGKRAVPGPEYDYKHSGQVCTSNPDVVATAAAWVNAFFDTHPDYRVVHITMNDGGGFCECERCQALDTGKVLQSAGIDAEETKGGAKRTVITDRIFTYVSQVSTRGQARHPGKYVASMAYSRYITPPEKIQLEQHVIPQYCMWSAYKHANPAIKQEHESIALGWARAAQHAAIYEYFINGSWPGMHRLVVPYIAESIRFLKRNGIELYETQSGDEFGTNGINYYVAGKLLWDPSIDEQALLRDFYSQAFGAAAPAVRRFHDRLQSAWTAATASGQDVSCQSIETTRLLELFTPKLIADCVAELSEAARLADTDSARRRVQFYRDGFRYTEVTVDAVRAVKGLDLKAVPPAGPGRAERKAQLTVAIDAIERRRAFVEQHRDGFVLPYFWARYSDEQRAAFLPLARLRSLAAAL